MTNTLYGDSEQLKANPPEADLYIAGSDQIWNTDMQNGTEPAFYLDFGNDATRRISYAASFGIEHINPQAEEWVKKLLSRFDSISVRERTGIDILKHSFLKLISGAKRSRSSRISCTDEGRI